MTETFYEYRRSVETGELYAFQLQVEGGRDGVPQVAGVAGPLVGPFVYDAVALGSFEYRPWDDDLDPTGDWVTVDPVSESTAKEEARAAVEREGSPIGLQEFYDRVMALESTIEAKRAVHAEAKEDAKLARADLVNAETALAAFFEGIRNPKPLLTVAEQPEAPVSTPMVPAPVNLGEFITIPGHLLIDPPPLDIDPDVVERVAREGITERLLVRAVPHGYEILDGADRFVAGRNFGIKEFPCLVQGAVEEKTEA